MGQKYQRLELTVGIRRTVFWDQVYSVRIELNCRTWSQSLQRTGGLLGKGKTYMQPNTHMYTYMYVSMCVCSYVCMCWYICAAAAAAATTKSLQSCPTVRLHRRQPTRLPHPWDSPGKNPGVGCISFSSAWKWKVKVKSLSRVGLFATPWTAAHQAPPSMGFSRQEDWSGWSLPSPISLLGLPKQSTTDAWL